MHPEALILRRCYPVPVTFADLRAAREVLAAKRRSACSHITFLMPREVGGYDWHAALKQVTGALDEVYALVDGREVRVAVVHDASGCRSIFHAGYLHRINDLLEVADEQGYWERPHEVRLDLSPRPVSHGEVARAVLVGQEYVERHGNR